MNAATGPSLPETVEELTAEWLEAALRPRFPDLTVERIDVEEIVWGTATKVRIRAAYGSSAAVPPAALCVKGGFDKRLRGLGATRAYRLEAGFFTHLAPALSIPLPGCWFAAVDEGRGQGILVLEDLVAAGARFGDPTEPWPVDRVAAALEVLAALHARTWGTTRDTHPWLPGHSIVRDVTSLLLDESHWAAHFADPSSPSPPGPLADRGAVLTALQRMWEHHADESSCITHGDAHLGNTYVAEDGPAFLDWQAVCEGPALDDVAYFIGGALCSADRRAHERDLLTHYLAALAAGGGVAPNADAAWLAYRRFSLHGFLWAVTPAVMQPSENVRAMAERHMTAVLDLDSLGALS